MTEIENPKKWHELQSKLKLKYPGLNISDLTIRDGNEQDMLRMVEYKLRMTRKELQLIIDEL